MALTTDEQRIYDEAAAGLLEIPDWLAHRLEVYACAFAAWRGLVPRIRRASDTAELYKVGGTSAVLLKQCDTALAAIERERERQKAAKAAKDADAGKLEMYDADAA